MTDTAPSSSRRLLLAAFVGVAFSIVDVPLVARALGVVLVTFGLVLLTPDHTQSTSGGAARAPGQSTSRRHAREGDGDAVGKQPPGSPGGGGGSASTRPRPGSPSSFGRARSPPRVIPNPLDLAYYAEPDPRVVSSRPVSRRGGSLQQPPVQSNAVAARDVLSTTPAASETDALTETLVSRARIPELAMAADVAARRAVAASQLPDGDGATDAEYAATKAEEAAYALAQEAERIAAAVGAAVSARQQTPAPTPAPAPTPTPTPPPPPPAPVAEEVTYYREQQQPQVAAKTTAIQQQQQQQAVMPVAKPAAAPAAVAKPAPAAVVKTEPPRVPAAPPRSASPPAVASKPRPVAVAPSPPPPAAAPDNGGRMSPLGRFMQKRRAAKEEVEAAKKMTVAADQDAGKDKGGRMSPIGRFRSPFGRRNAGSPEPEPERKQEVPDKALKAGGGGGRFWSPQRKREEPQQPVKVPAAPQLPPARVPPAAPVAQQAKQAPAPVKIASPPPKQAQQQQPPQQQRQPPAMQQQLRAVQAQQRGPPGREDSFSASDFTDEEDYESETASDDSPPIRRR